MPYFTADDIPEPDVQLIFELYVTLNDVDGMRALITQGVDLNRNCAEYCDGNTLVLAVESDSIAAMEYLLDAGVGLDSAALKTAAVRGNTKIVEKLLSAGVRPDPESLVGVDDLEIVRLLLAACAPLNLEGKNGPWFALHNAVIEDQVDLVEMLLKSGADPNLCSAEGWTPLMIAVRGGELSIVTLLLTYGANPKLKNHDNETALDIALAGGWNGAAELVR